MKINKQQINKQLYAVFLSKILFYGVSFFIMPVVNSNALLHTQRTSISQRTRARFIQIQLAGRLASPVFDCFENEIRVDLLFSEFDNIGVIILSGRLFY